MSGDVNENVCCMVSQILDKEGNSLCIVNENIDFKPQYLYQIILPESFVRDYGVKRDMHIDLLLTEIYCGTRRSQNIPKKIIIREN